jgi:hypothetical protein
VGFARGHRKRTALPSNTPYVCIEFPSKCLAERDVCHRVRDFALVSVPRPPPTSLSPFPPYHMTCAFYAKPSSSFTGFGIPHSTHPPPQSPGFADSDRGSVVPMGVRPSSGALAVLGGFVIPYPSWEFSYSSRDSPYSSEGLSRASTVLTPVGVFLTRVRNSHSGRTLLTRAGSVSTRVRFR